MIPTPLPDVLAVPPLPAPGERWAAFLDLDGTLVGFSEDPSGVTLAPETLAALRKLDRALDGAFAIVSGRPIADLDRLLGDFRPGSVAGKHGHEWRTGAAVCSTAAPPVAMLETARAGARALAAALPGVRLEDKGDAFALHYRARPEHRAAVTEGVERILATAQSHWVVQRGDHVVELIPAGADKGRALERLMTLPPFAQRTPVAIGDDYTDEHMFESAATLGGFGVVVGSRRPTAARYALEGPEAVRVWLDGIAAAFA